MKYVALVLSIAACIVAGMLWLKDRPSSRTQWEYTWDTQDGLVKLGNEGWEVVLWQERGQWYLFKRPRSDD